MAFVDARAFAVFTCGFTAFVNLYSPQALLPELAHEFSVTPGQISALMTASTGAIALTAPFTGALADVLGRKRLIAAAAFAVLVPTLIMTLTSSVPQLVLWRFLQGLLLPPIFTVAVAYIGEEWPPAEIPRVTGIYVAGSSFGGFCGRFIPGLVADIFGWRSSFAAVALLTLVGAILIATLLPRERNFVRSPGIAASSRQMLRHLSNPRLLAIYAVGFGVLFNFLAAFTYVNFHLAAPPYLFSPTLLGTIFVTYLGGTLLVPWVGRPNERFGRRAFIIGVVAVWAAGVLLMLSRSIGMIIGGLAVCAACGLLCQAVSTGYVITTAKEGRSSAVGLYASIFYIGGSAGAFFTGFAWNAAGWPGCIAVIVVMLAIVESIVALAWERTPAT